MKIYLILNGTLITGYSLEAVEGAPCVEIDNPSTIKLGIDTFEGGVIISKVVPTEITKQKRINELKALLSETDYMCLKHADGELTDEEYAIVKAQRHAWREEINELEG